VHEARRLKSFHTNVELLSEKLLEEKGRRERAETELSKLREIEAKAHKLELELASCTSLLSNIPDVSSYSNFADLQRYVSIITLTKEKCCYSSLLLKTIQITIFSYDRTIDKFDITFAQNLGERMVLSARRYHFVLLSH
jgi:mitotic spindle assembly checkpoint protein MAD1